MFVSDFLGSGSGSDFITGRDTEDGPLFFTISHGGSQKLKSNYDNEGPKDTLIVFFEGGKALPLRKHLLSEASAAFGNSVANWPGQKARVWGEAFVKESDGMTYYKLHIGSGEGWHYRSGTWAHNPKPKI